MTGLGDFQVAVSIVRQVPLRPTGRLLLGMVEKWISCYEAFRWTASDGDGWIGRFARGPSPFEHRGCIGRRFGNRRHQ